MNKTSFNDPFISISDYILLLRMPKPKKKEKNSSLSSTTKAPRFVVTKWGIGCFILALISGFINKWHVETMFENDKHFSHLGN